MSRSLYANPHHMFEYGGRYVLYDVIQGAFFEADAVVQDVMLSCDDRSIEELVALLSDRYDEAVVRHTCFELVEAGLLSMDSPESLRPFVPPGRMEVVQLGLNLSDQLSGTSSPLEMTELVAKRSVDLLMKASGRLRACELGFHGGDEYRHASLVADTITYAQTRACALGKTLGVVLYGRQWLGQAWLEGLKDQHIDVVVEVGAPSEDLLEIQNADMNVHLQGPMKIENADASEWIGLDTTQVPRIKSLKPLLDTHSVADMSLEGALASLENLAKHVVKHTDGPWVGDFEDCVAQVYNRTVAYYYCGAGTRYLTVSPSGHLYVCPELVNRNEFCVGDVFEGIDHSRLGAWIKSTHVDQFEACSGCWARYLCGGGCRFKALMSSGQIGKPDAESCAVIRKSYELAMGVCLDLAARDPLRLDKRYAEAS